jgi:hypothetical protein
VHRSSRALLGAAAFVSFAGAFVTTPLVVNGEINGMPTGAPSAVPSPAATFLAQTVPRRNPFAGGRATSVQHAPAPAPTQLRPGVTPPGGIPAMLQPLPPNAGAPNEPFPFAKPSAPGSAPLSSPVSARVTAIVTGPRPYALLEEGGTIRLVGVGDRVGPDTIVAITADSVRLAGGATLLLIPAGRPSR